MAVIGSRILFIKDRKTNCKITGVSIMKKTIVLYPVSCIILMLIFSSIVKANHTSVEFQKLYFDVGYKGVYQALKECNKHFKKDIALPVQLPPIAFTYSFGRCNNLDGKANDGYEIEYLHRDEPINHYMIRIQPNKYGIPIRKEHIDQTLKLKDGKTAIYTTKLVNGFNLLVFEKNDFQYVLSIDKRVSDKVTPEILTEIANSI
jgi:hypothetical protein